ncbi:MAG: hypothetical protein K2W96_09870 [Gemmataceae bacterium]|nr:hypothetical protein [Gemmataceae bacterium]
MTVVGKLLVFLNLVFSLVVGTFAVFDYSARTHWADYAKKLEASNAVEKGNAAGYKASAEEKSKIIANLNAAITAGAGKELELKKETDPAKIGTTLMTLLEQRKKELDNQAARIAQLQTEIQAEKNKVSNFKSATDAGILDVGVSKKDVEQMRVTIRSLHEDWTKAVKSENSMRDQKVAAEIERDAVQSRNQALLADRLKLDLENKRLQALLGSSGAGGTTMARRPGGRTPTSPDAPPPSENVEGLVSATDGNLVKISIGSDSGLAKGQKLVLFRLGAAPKFLGSIRLVEVTPSEAVGQAMGRFAAPVQKGDRAASHIFPR